MVQSPDGSVKFAGTALNLGEKIRFNLKPDFNVLKLITGLTK